MIDVLPPEFQEAVKRFLKDHDLEQKDVECDLVVELYIASSNLVWSKNMRAGKAREIAKMLKEMQPIFDKIRNAAIDGETSIKVCELTQFQIAFLCDLDYHVEDLYDSRSETSDGTQISW